MTKRMLGILGLLALIAAAVPAATESAAPERIVVPLTDPAKPATINVEMMFGAVKITGYNGKDVIVEAKQRPKSATANTGLARIFGPVATATPAPAAPPALAAAPEKEPPAPSVAPRPRSLGTATPRPWPSFPGSEEKDKERKAKAAGMKAIPLDNSGLTIEEENNVVSLSVESWRGNYELSVQVPVHSILKIEGGNIDECVIDNITGEIEIEAGGDIKLTNVSGTVVASSMRGGIEAKLNRINPDKPMSLATFNGDVDLTLPPDVKASLRIKAAMGEVFSDFDVALKSLPVEQQKAPGREGAKYRVSLERAVLGAINGGGTEIKLDTFNGDIYIRKRK